MDFDSDSTPANTPTSAESRFAPADRGHADLLRRRSRPGRPIASPPHRPFPARPAPAGARGRTRTGTVHLVTADGLTACGTGLNSWDPRSLQPTERAVTCKRCAEELPPDGQLALF